MGPLRTPVPERPGIYSVRFGPRHPGKNQQSVVHNTTDVTSVSASTPDQVRSTLQTKYV